MPPARTLLAALVGFKPKPPPSRNYTSLVNMFPKGKIG